MKTLNLSAINAAGRVTNKETHDLGTDSFNEAQARMWADETTVRVQIEPYIDEDADDEAVAA